MEHYAARRHRRFREHARSAIYYRTCWRVSRVEERSLKIIMLAAVALFVVGAIAEGRDTHTVWGQGGTFLVLLGFAAVGPGCPGPPRPRPPSPPRPHPVGAV